MEKLQLFGIPKGLDEKDEFKQIQRKLNNLQRELECTRERIIWLEKKIDELIGLTKKE